ncbi:MAG: HlyD family efflux transporter periplasmic adaptor subunit [Planctomycetales bacterium]|nr:HlyD family efflux transporter periplasmic adaptor subunit [Planctomycetales bacterium]
MHTATSPAAAKTAARLAGLKKLALEAATAEQFHCGWLEQVVALCAASGGRLRRPATDGALAIAAELRFVSEPHDAAASEADEHPQASRYEKLVFGTFVAGTPKAVPPRLELRDEADANPTSGALVLAPLFIDDETRGVVELVLPQIPAGDGLQRLLGLIQAAAGAVGQFERRRREAALAERSTLVDEMERFTRSVHQDLSLRGTAYAVVNDGRRLIGCDRVSLLVRRGRRFELLATSGLEVVERRSQAAKLMSRMAGVVAEAAEPVWQLGKSDELPPQIRAALGEYVDEAHVRGVAVLPLLAKPDPRKPQRRPRVLGSLVIEQIEDVSPVAGRVERAELVAQHAAGALANALEYQSIPLLPLWRKVAKLRNLFAPGTRRKTLAVATLVIAAILALKCVPADLALSAKGTLQPAERRHVFAPLDGTVHTIHVRHGERVAAGELLVELRNTDLDVALADAVGQHTAAGEQLLAVERALYEDSTKLLGQERHRLAGQRSELKQKLASLDEQIRLLRRKRELLKITSPIAGEVTTWNVEQLLQSRPVRQGQVLVDVAAVDGAWEMELQVPENDIGHLLRAQQQHGPALEVRYRLAADPDHDRTALVSEVHYAAEVRGEEGNTVLVRTTLGDTNLPPLRPGAEASAKVYAGRRALGYVWLHDAVDFVRTKVLFRLY